MDFKKPIYQLDGKSYKSVNGLVSALMKKHGAHECGCFNRDRILKVYADRNTVCATYQSTVPELGKPIVLTQIA
jgi:hypothetical protein